MGELYKKVLGKSLTKVTTKVAIAVSLLGLFSDQLLPMAIPFLSPGKALAVGAAVTWLGRLRGVLSEVKAELDTAQ